MPKVLKGPSKHHLDQDVAEYRELRAKIAFLESELKPVRDRIEKAVESAPNHQIFNESYKITLTDVTRESFNLKLAREALGTKMLKPYTTVLQYKSLRIL